MNDIESWFLNVALGKFAAQAAVLIAAYVAGPVVQSLAAKAGVHIAVDPAKLQAELMILSTGALKWFESRRAANPNSPAVQTDATQPGAESSAAQMKAPPLPTIQKP